MAVMSKLEGFVFLRHRVGSIFSLREFEEFLWSHFHFLAHQLPQKSFKKTHLSNTATSQQFWLVPATTQGDEQQQRPGDSGLSNHLHLGFMISTLEVFDARDGWESVMSIATQAEPNLPNYLNMRVSETWVKITRFRFSSTSLSKQWRRTTLMQPNELGNLIKIFHLAPSFMKPHDSIH